MRRFAVLLAAIGIGAGALLAAAPLGAQNYYYQYPNASCMQQAVQARANGFVEAYNRYNAGVTQALSARGSAEVNAWAQGDSWQRDSELQAATDTFASSFNDAGAQLYYDKLQVRQAYNADARACVAQPPAYSSSSSSSLPSDQCICPMYYAPVCGTDGRTYTNDCYARCVNVGIVSNSQCGASSSSANSCICTKEYAPVCGANGQSYGNGCQARCAGTSIAYQGNCSAGTLQCGSYGSCRNGQACPGGTQCSGIPAYGCYPPGCPYPICLSVHTRIATPNGTVAVTDLKVGDVVWTQTADGKRIAAPLVQVGHMAVPSTHRMIQLVLEDGRTAEASPGHPLAGGARLDRLKAGESYDGSTVVSAANVPYDGTATYDILPAGDTGEYWADGVLLGSTLFVGK